METKDQVEIDPMSLPTARAMFVFDFDGTLRGGKLTDAKSKEMIRKLRDGGHRVVIWSGGRVPQEWRKLVDAVWAKDGTMKAWDHLDASTIVFADDDGAFRRTVEKYIRIMRPDLTLSTLTPDDLVELAA